MYREYIDEIKHTLDKIPWHLVEKTVDLLHAARLSHQRIFVLGNGGSATTAQHMACDLNKNTRSHHLAPFRVMSLSDNMALFSAFANDEGYENVFAGQLENFVEPDDVVVAISASGNSPNVLTAIKLAKSRHAHTIGWSGYDGGRLAQLADIPLVVPNHCIEQIEDVHMMLEHIVTSALRTKAIEKAHAPTIYTEADGSHVAA